VLDAAKISRTISIFSSAIRLAQLNPIS
jgi:hypothetical protein